MNSSVDQLADLQSLAKKYLPRIPTESFNPVASAEVKVENSTNPVIKDDFANDAGQSNTAEQDTRTSAPANSIANLTIDGEVTNLLGLSLTTTAKTLLPLPMAPVVDALSTTASTAVDLATKPTVTIDAGGKKREGASLWDRFTGGITSMLGLNDPNSFTTRIWNVASDFFSPITNIFQSTYDLFFTSDSSDDRIEAKRIAEEIREEEYRRQEDIKRYYEEQRLEREYCAKVNENQRRRVEENAKANQEVAQANEAHEAELKRSREEEAKKQELKKIVGMNVVVTSSDTVATLIDRALEEAEGNDLDLFLQLMRNYKGVDLSINISKLNSAACGDHLIELLDKVRSVPSIIVADNTTKEIIKQYTANPQQFNLLI